MQTISFPRQLIPILKKDEFLVLSYLKAGFDRDYSLMSDFTKVTRVGIGKAMKGLKSKGLITYSLKRLQSVYVLPASDVNQNNESCSLPLHVFRRVKHKNQALQFLCYCMRDGQPLEKTIPQIANEWSQASGIKLSKRTAQNYIKELCESNIITVTKVGQKSKIEIPLPEVVQVADSFFSIFGFKRQKTEKP